MHYVCVPVWLSVLLQRLFCVSEGGGGGGGYEEFKLELFVCVCMACVVYFMCE